MMLKRLLRVIVLFILLILCSTAIASERVLGENPLGLAFPTPQSVLRRAPETDYYSDNSRYQKYSDVGEKEYILYSKLLKAYNILTEPKPVRWYVMKREGNEAYLLSVRSFGTHQYIISENQTWENSELTVIIIVLGLV